MLSSSNLLSSIYPDANALTPLLAQHISSLRASADHDAAWSYRSAVSSLVTALQAINSGQRSWPLIQLYYSLFFSMRSILYSNDVCIYYCIKKPMQVLIRAGETPAKLTFQGASSSHIAAARVFRARFPRHPLSGDIEFTPAVDWMRSLRELVNYNDPTMNLDDHLALFGRVISIGVRRTLAFYTSDLPLYAFLAEDAAIALPLLAAKQAVTSLSSGCGPIIQNEIRTTLARLKDTKGLIKTLDILMPGGASP